MSSCAGLIPNPDLTGLPLRISVYIQVFAVGSLDQIRPEDTTSHPLVWHALFLTTLALIIASLASSSLTLFDALIVLTLLNLLLLPLVHARHGPKRHIGPTHLLVAGLVLVLFERGFELWVYVTARHFGAQPECNGSTRLVLFGADLDAVQTGRTLGIVLLVVLGLGLSVPFFVFFILVSVDWHGFSRFNSSPWWRFTRYDNRKERIRRHANLILNFLFQFCWLVAQAEQTILGNNVLPSEDPWTLGQVLSLLITIPALLTIKDSALRMLREKRMAAPKLVEEDDELPEEPMQPVADLEQGSGAVPKLVEEVDEVPDSEEPATPAVKGHLVGEAREAGDAVQR